MRIHEVNEMADENFEKKFVGCIVLTHDYYILLQQRDGTAPTFPHHLGTFGGSIEANETSQKALIRELKEELGAKVLASDIIFLGKITDGAAAHQQLIHSFFWHDKHHTITGCYEGSAKAFQHIDIILQQTNVMDDVCWMLKKCKELNLLS